MSSPHRRLTGADVLAASLEAMAGNEQDEVILEAMGLGPRPGLYLDHGPRR